MSRHPSHILELARRGAETRFQELIDEARLLLKLFPHLRDSFDADELPVNFLIATGARRDAKGSPQRGLSSTGRKAISEPMTKNWATRRKEERD
jgi:hypothetical protein